MGGIFSQEVWESARHRIHHNDYHYRFYHYLNASGSGSAEERVGDIAKALVVQSAHLPSPVSKAFKNWPVISVNLHDLFQRAPLEAIAEPDAIIARMAIREVEQAEYPPAVTRKVLEKANQVLETSMIRNREKIERVIAEPRRLVKALDAFVARFSVGDEQAASSRDQGAIPLAEAERLGREFLQNCRRLDRALSAIPKQLEEAP